MSSDVPVHLPNFGLYYPYINFRDDSWVKIAALYRPKMARVVPVGYPTSDSIAVKALNEKLDWTINIPPDEVRRLVAPAFYKALYELSGPEWRPGWIYKVQPSLDVTTPPAWGGGPGEGVTWWGTRTDDRVAAIYSTELEPELCRQLIHLDLAKPISREIAQHEVSSRDQFIVADVDEFMRDGGWLVMHRDLVWVYKCLLSKMLADRNRLTLSTDQVEAHVASSGYSARELILGGIVGREEAGDLATTFGLMAIRTVVPKDVANVPVEKVALVRKNYGDQFDAWREHIDGIGVELAHQLESVDSPAVLQRYLTKPPGSMQRHQSIGFVRGCQTSDSKPPTWL